MIYENIPHNWKNLQKKVGSIFQTLGFEVEIEKIIETARESVEIDVYAKDASQTPNIIYLCECKHWNTKVPKSIVLSFRTIVNDYGCNVGYIISKKGFQKGAYECIKNTNIELLDWFSFQKRYGERWFIAKAHSFYKKFLKIIDYTEPINAGIYKKNLQLNEYKKREFYKLQKKYETLGFLLATFCVPEFIKYDLPIKYIRYYDEDEKEIISFNDFENFFNTLEYDCNQGLEKFNKIFNEI
ncbi:MAG: restriction endonuclease [Candidatus Methanofastidiosia archaeon]